MSSYSIRYPNLLKNVPQRLQLLVRNRAAEHHLSRGCAILSTGRYVLTDRLHGHILCMLLGIPHILLDNSYGKNRGFFEQWTRESDLVRFVKSLDEVPGAVQDLMKFGTGESFATRPSDRS
jgi:pyruvyl transferase EpsO